MFKGSLYGQWEAIVTFTVMIVLADKNGEVDMTPEALSAATSIPLEIIRKGYREPRGVRPRGRTPDEDGRRIVRVSDTRTWGWTITNYEHYRAIRTTEERREYFRQYKRKHRPKRNKSPQCPPVGTESPQIPPIAVSSKQRQEAEESSSSPLERFVEPSHRAAYLAIRAEVQHAQSFDAMLETLVVPISGGSVRMADCRSSHPRDPLHGRKGNAELHPRVLPETHTARRGEREARDRRRSHVG